MHDVPLLFCHFLCILPEPLFSTTQNAFIVGKVVAYIVMACIGMTYIVMTYIVMTFMAMAYMAMAAKNWIYGPPSVVFLTCQGTTQSHEATLKPHRGK